MKGWQYARDVQLQKKMKKQQQQCIVKTKIYVPSREHGK